jgi:hypothetical protein
MGLAKDDEENLESGQTQIVASETSPLLLPSTSSEDVSVDSARNSRKATAIICLLMIGMYPIMYNHEHFILAPPSVCRSQSPFS